MLTKEVTNESGLTDAVTEPLSYALTILMALNRKVGLRMYQGTVDSGEIARRRKANKMAKAQRKINRSR